MALVVKYDEVITLLYALITVASLQKNLVSLTLNWTSETKDLLGSYYTCGLEV